MGAQVWVADGRAGFICVEAAGELGVGFEFGRATVELTGVGEDHSGAAVHGLDDAADLDVEIAIFAELADLVVVFPRADYGETTVVVGGLGGADVEETGAVGKLNDVVDMRGDANVVVEHFGGLVGGEAGLGGGVGGEGEESGGESHNKTVRGARAHGGRFPGNGGMLARCARDG